MPRGSQSRFDAYAIYICHRLYLNFMGLTQFLFSMQAKRLGYITCIFMSLKICFNLRLNFLCSIEPGGVMIIRGSRSEDLWI